MLEREDYIMANKNKTMLWLQTMSDRIIVQNNIIDYTQTIRGVYGIFVEDGEKRCVYVGKSNNIYMRMFGGHGHLTKLMKGLHTNTELKTAIFTNQKIYIDVLTYVPYIFDNYYKDMQRLASAENACIDYYQNLDQCLHQVPEGNAITEQQWQKKKQVSQPL